MISAPERRRPKPKMKHAAIGIVAAGRIDDTDLAYRITTETEVEGLARSIAAAGVLNPPILAPRNDEWIVIAGFRRVAACRRLGWTEILCRMLPSAVSPLDRARMAVADNSGQRPLNPLELSRAFQLLATHLSSERRLPEEARSVGLPHHPKLIEKLRGLCLLAEPIQKGVMSDAISLSVVRDLERMPEAEALGFARWFLAVPMSLNRQREVLTLVREIARREDRSILEVLDDPEFTALMEDPEGEGARRGRRLQRRLRRRRFPALSRAEDDFEKRRSRLSLGEGMELVPPKNFEGGRFELRLAFSRCKALEKMAETAARLARNPELAGILGEE